MNSPIKLPPLPELPPEIIVDEGYDGEIYMGQDEVALRAWATAYAAQAVREALAAQSEWMPIETAPKDGSHLLLRCGGASRVADGFWLQDEEGCGAWIWPYSADEPIYWQPLPASPKENNHAEGSDQ